uniref:receptor protein-tyrosine kinase n=1 Tax=Romanomermis culicivorax TaxID=13658 RepID=A0A915HLP0_ROMCU
MLEKYIKVSFSKSLSSLDFFKNLRIIRGNALWAGRFAFTIFQNKNLVSMWNRPSNSAFLRILNGGIQFQNNPRLCMDEIQNFAQQISLPSHSDKDISPFSNSNTVKIDLTVGFSDKHVVVLNWTPYEGGEFIGYKVYFRTVNDESVDINVDRDSCGEQWTMNFFQNDLTQGLLRNLSADTLYALYVQTATVHGKGHPVGISDVKYVRTKYAAPSAPRFVEKSSTKNQISLVWIEPEKPHGQITHYKISITMKPMMLDDGVNYCAKHTANRKMSALTIDWRRNVETSSDAAHSPFISAHSSPFGTEASLAAQILKINNKNEENCPKRSCCFCVEDKRNKIDLDKNVELSIFEDRIHEVIFPSMSYSYESGRRRRKRSIKNNVNIPKASIFLHADTVQPFNSSYDYESLKIDDYSTFSPVFTFNASTSHFTFQNLQHFSLYEFRIWACQNRTVRRNYCSYEPLTLQVLTQHSVQDDIIDYNTISIKVINHTDRSVSWKAPAYPNGQILAFEIRYRRVDSNETSANLYSKCVPVVDSRRRNYNLTLSDLSPGDYEFRIRAVTQANTVYWTEINFSVDRLSTFDLVLIAFCAVTIAFLSICVLTTGYFYFKRLEFSSKYVMQFFSANPDYFSQVEVYKADEWELNRDELQLIREIGSGTFGKVYEGRALFSPVKSQCGLSFTRCAVKTVSEKADMFEKFRFLIEASVMKQFTDAAFIVKLFGVVSEGHPTLVVMELMDQGSLKEYLMSRRPDPEYNTYGLNPPSYEETLRMAAEIVDGMAYLEAHQFCHRDLAARNCLVAADGTCKIGDFGMTRNLYDRSYYKPSGRRLMPVRWMAPEALRDAIFTSKSYGVLLWEIVTLAQQPYAGLSNEDVFNFVVDSQRTMDKPTGCPFLFETLMRQCWQYEAKSRPTFEYFASQLEPYQELAFHSISYFCKSTGCLVGQIPECSETDYLLSVQQRGITVTADCQL